MAATPSYSRNFIALARGYKRLQISDPLAQCLAPSLTRCYATHTQLPADTTPHPPTPPSIPADRNASPASLVKTRQPVLATLYSWPSLEPEGITTFKADQLNLPLRKDILHRAVVYEGDMTRQGSASTKWRDDIRGSGRKVRPQKGTGRARLSDIKSPMLKGGGVAHGPHPRDFSTDLPEKVYNLAWRTALSHRYKKGEMIILSNEVSLAKSQGPAFLANVLQKNGWGRGKGRSLVVVQKADEPVSKGFEAIGRYAELATVGDVDVKDLLSCERVVIESEALKHILATRRLQG